MGQRFEGRNLEEALTAASQALGAERYQLTYHVLLEKRGFLGGMKRVVIEAEVNETSAAPSKPVAPEVAPSARPSRPRERQAPPRQREGGSRPGERRAGGRGGRRRRQGERDEPRPEMFAGDLESPGEPPPQAEESEAASTVRAWCEQVIRLAGLSGELRTEENETQIVVRIYGRDAARFTERNGELLDAVQVLANKALTGRKVEKEIELDCAAFKGRRVEELGEQAHALADRVRRDGREQLLPAMSPIERRIVHLALAEDADVTTESRGDGFFKRVAIVPRPAGQQSES